jgi:predicted GIY-YIG superfamily endonuclease
MMTPGYVYLLCFEQPIGNLSNPRAQARHYIGWTPGYLDDRIREHRGSRGPAAITAFLTRHLIDFTLVRAWHGTVADEKRLKAIKASARICPRCRGQRRRGGGVENPGLDMELALAEVRRVDMAARERKAS